MKKMKMLALMLTLAMFAFSCGGSDDKDDNGSPTDGGSTSGLNSSSGSLGTHTGTNAAVTESDVDDVSSEVTAKAFQVFGRAMETAQYGGVTKPNINQVINLDGKVNGYKSGYAQVKGTYSINMTGTTVGSYTYNFTATYYDFADDESMYLGGGLKYSGTVTNVSDYNNMKYSITIKGGLKFNGDYEGTQDFTTVYSITGGNVTWTSETKTVSGGKTFNKTIKYPE